MPDNKRYVGDVFIDGETDKLLHTFLTNLFNQYNGEGRGFNADMLDGHHYQEIEDALDELDASKLSSIIIGGKLFDVNNPSQSLNFRDILYNSDYDELIWNSDELENALKTNDSLADALNLLYEIVFKKIADEVRALDLAKVNREKVDKDDESEDPRMKVLSDNNFSDEDKLALDRFKQSIGKTFVGYTDENNISQFMLNSQLTNGLRFILITQSKYNEYKNSEDANKQNFINSWRNVFIFKEENEMPNQLDYESPLNYQLEDGFSFRLANSDEGSGVTNDIDSSSPNPIWLQIKHNWVSEWTNFIALDDLLAGVDFDNIVMDVVSAHSDEIQISPEAIYAVVHDMLLNSQSEYYVDLEFMPASKENEFLQTFVQDVVKDNNSLATVQNTSLGPEKIVDISDAFDDEFTSLSDKINGISNAQKTGTLDAEIDSLNRAVMSLDSTINGDSPTAVLEQLKTINGTLSSIDSNIRAIKSDITELQKLDDWKCIEWRSGGNNLGRITYNNAMNIVQVYINEWVSFTKNNINKWVKFPHHISDTFASLRPWAMALGVGFTSTSRHPIFFLIQADGDIYVYSAHAFSDAVNVRGTVMYKKRGGIKGECL